MRIPFSGLALLLCGSLAADPTIDWPDVEAAQQPRPEWLITAQPEPHELVALHQAGVRHVVNARGADELDRWDQEALLRQLGMQHHRVPIAGIDDLDLESVMAFDRILEKIGDEPALMHCASGNRVGALFALRAAWLHGEPPDKAIELGRRHGLTGLEDTVRELLTED